MEQNINKNLKKKYELYCNNTYPFLTYKAGFH